ncbi:MAG TPA: hypothetical protein ENK50_00870 [Sedimenticola sp.]|nr:hypothetical protein [Sedimenticola sp.]
MSSTPLRSIGYKWLTILLAVVLVQCMEAVVLQGKYSLFTGGFLQPYSFRSLPDRLLFLILSFWMNVLLLGIVGHFWFWLADRLRLRRLTAAYNFLFVSVALFGFWLAFKFKVLSYFSDTLDFVIARNLAGGSLAAAFRYVADESTIFLAGLAASGLLYWLGLAILRRWNGGGEEPVYTPPRLRLRYLLPLLVVVTTLLVAWIGRVPQLRYGLGKTTAYSLIANTLDRLSDFDGDGYGLFRFPPDIDNFDAQVHPGALDVPGNGLDEDGYGGDFHWVGGTPDPLAELPPQPGTHILLVVLESARADLVGKRWNGRLVAPNLTQMAREGSRVEYAYSHTGYTVTSLLALFNRTLFAGGGRVRLLDYLDSSGYQVSILSGQDESFGRVATLTGMKGKDHYYFDARVAIEDRVFPSKDSGSLRLSEARVVQAFRQRLKQVDWNRPNFFYVNFQAAHFPYSHPGMPMILIDRPVQRKEIRPENREKVQATYWNAIAVADDAFGKLISALKEKGVYRDTLVVVLGDHGESLFDNGHLGHGFELNEIQTRIPLILNRKGVEVRQAVGQLEVAELLVTLATDRFDPARWQDGRKPVFQFVGSLNRPALIDTVRYGEVRTLLNLGVGKVFFSDLERWRAVEEALSDPVTGPRTRQLIQAWETVRWQAHQARESSR